MANRSTDSTVELEWGSFDQAKQAVKLAFKHRQAIANGELYPFIPAFVFALFKDGLFDMVPIVGKPFSLFIAVYLFIFLWGKGKWKVRIVIFLLSMMDVIPGVDLLPLSTICVAYAYFQAKKHADQAKEELGGLEIQTNAERIREYQMARVATATAQAAKNAASQFQAREAANENVFESQPVRKVS